MARYAHVRGRSVGCSPFSVLRTRSRRRETRVTDAVTLQSSRSHSMTRACGPFDAFLGLVDGSPDDGSNLTGKANSSPTNDSNGKMLADTGNTNSSPMNDSNGKMLADIREPLWEQRSELKGFLQDSYSSLGEELEKNFAATRSLQHSFTSLEKGQKKQRAATGLLRDSFTSLVAEQEKQRAAVGWFVFGGFAMLLLFGHLSHSALANELKTLLEQQGKGCANELRTFLEEQVKGRTNELNTLMTARNQTCGPPERT